jgi:hypothetical protein
MLSIKFLVKFNSPICTGCAIKFETAIAALTLKHLDQNINERFRELYLSYCGRGSCYFCKQQKMTIKEQLIPLVRMKGSESCN